MSGRDVWPVDPNTYVADAVDLWDDPPHWPALPVDRFPGIDGLVVCPNCAQLHSRPTLHWCDPKGKERRND